VRRNSSIGGDILAGGSVDLRNNVSVGGVVDENAIVESIEGLPQISIDIVSTGDDITVGNGESQTIPPGNYGNLIARENSNVTLASGAYVFSDFLFKKNSELNIDAGNGAVVVLVSGNVIMQENTQMFMDSNVHGQRRRIKHSVCF